MPTFYPEDFLYSQSDPYSLAVKMNSVAGTGVVGDVTTLTTTAKNSTVAAINEIDASVTAAEALLASSLAQLMTFQIPALTAGTDVAGQVLAAIPTGYSFVILSADIISNGSPSGIDAGNTCVVTVKNQAASVASKTYDNVAGFPEDNAVSNLGTIANATVAAGSAISLYVTNGATAVTPKFILQLMGKLVKAA